MIFINKTQIYLCEFQTPTAHNFFQINEFLLSLMRKIGFERY